MINVIDALLFRLKKAKSFWILLGLCLVFPAAVLLLSGLLEWLAAGSGEMVGGMLALSALITTASPTGALALLVIISTSVFLCGEFRDGTVRNALLSNKSRAQLFFAYAIVGGIIAYSYAFAYYLSSVALYSLAYGNLLYNITGITAMDMLGLFLLTLVATLVTLTIELFFLFTTRKQSSAIILPIVITYLVIPFVSNIGASLTSYVDEAVLNWLPLVHYQLVISADSSGAGLNGMAMISVIIYSLVAVCGLGTGGYFAFANADLK